MNGWHKKHVSSFSVVDETTSLTMNISVVIPVYRGVAALEPLVGRLVKAMNSLADSYEVILVNDGSPDRSWEVIQFLAGRYSFVRGINLMRNYGQHNATLCGVLQARYETIITMDDDLQHQPEDIPSLVVKLNEGYDVVYGVPKRRNQSWWRGLFGYLTKRAVASVMRTKAVRDIGSFRAFQAYLREAFRDYHNPEVILDVLLSWGTDRFTVVQVEEGHRAAGQSNYNFWKLAGVAMRVMTSFSTAPLRLASFIGFLFTLVGLGIFIYVLVIYFTAGSIPGFPFLASIISLFSGAQLFALGIIGEYLARIFDRTARQPCFTVKEMVTGQDA
jgi:glycosyltransferase involved in cell wall biosynthesis